MKTTRALGPIGLALVLGCQGAQDLPVTAASIDVEDDSHELGDTEDEEVIAANEIPAAVQAAALAAVPGLAIEEAEREMQDGQLVYCVHGFAEGPFTEVEVTADGIVLEIEVGDEEDD